MNVNASFRLASALVVATVLNAQVAQERDRVPLKHWAAPLYWQPTVSSDHGRAVAPEAATTGLPATASPLVFVAMTPCRVVDTRTVGGAGLTGAFGPPSLVGGVSRTFPILSSTTCAIPTAAQAYSFEITVVPPGPLAYITAYPTGQSAPVAALAVESPQGALASNTGVIPAGTSGSVDVYASSATDLVIDINGYYASFTSPACIEVGCSNFALGNGALQNNTTGAFNTASGALALQDNTTGSDNTGYGYLTLSENTNGILNTAVGSGALSSNTTGVANTAVGAAALHNITGGYNSAFGASALQFNTAGSFNTAIGSSAMDNSSTGNNNTAIGYRALVFNAAGNNNIAIGYQAAYNLTGGTNSNNIYIGTVGSLNDNATIRIGGNPSLTPFGDAAGQTSFYASGIRGTTTGNNDAIPVVIDSNGQLGTVSSSIRFKEDVHDMGGSSSGLMRLRPVTFRYQKAFADGSKPIQYGLIAEEVAKVYPDLVAHSADGQIESVKYQVLDSMLLNELQKEHAEVQRQAETIRLLEERLSALERAGQER